MLFSLQSVKLNPSFYQRDDVCLIARELLGKVLVTKLDGRCCKAIITETEAYNGRVDKAAHSFGNRRTARTEVMYHQGGVAYVYLCYGIHHLFNVVTNQEGLADAVLIRACEPLEGTVHMLERRKMQKPAPRLTSGPGSMAQALGIKTDYSGTDLQSDWLYIENAPVLPDEAIHHTTRIGVDYAGEDALLPWRYYMKDSPWISKK